MTPDKELQYQARIRELREALAEYTNVVSSGWNPNSFAPEVVDSCGPARAALSRPDDLSALDAYVLEEKRKALEEAAQMCDDRHLYTGYDCAEAIRSLAEELK